MNDNYDLSIEEHRVFYFSSIHLHTPRADQHCALNHVKLVSVA